MLEGICGYDDRTYQVKPTCEVVVSDMQSPKIDWEYCGQPTTHFYPAMGGGTMPLCHEHAQKHIPHGAWPAAAPSTGDTK